MPLFCLCLRAAVVLSVAIPAMVAGLACLAGAEIARWAKGDQP